MPYAVGYYARRFRRWRTLIRTTPPGELAYAIGLFVLIYCVLGLAWIGFTFAIGVNPTLVLSPIAAPVWILLILGSYRLQRFLRGV